MSANSSDFSIFKFSHDGMDTYNRITIYHNSKTYAEQAAAAAFKELDRLAGILSRFEEGNDIWQINRSPAGKAVQVHIETYECLKLSIQLSKLTYGAFDITPGNLYQLWKAKMTPDDGEIELMRRQTGMSFIQVSPEEYSVIRLNEAVSIDLGAIGKGYIVDKMAEILEEWDLPSAMINSGGSTLLALDPPAKKDGWSITCGSRKFMLKQGAVSGSGTGAQGEHIIDPRTGHPAAHRGRQWSMAPTAAIADALSTAAMVMTDNEKDSFSNSFPEAKLIGDK